MSAKHFLIAHGEKVAISVTLLACAAQLVVTFTDESIRPKSITPADIEAKNTGIDSVFAQGKAPVMKPVPGYLSDMEARFARSLPLPAMPSWLMAPPDRGPGSGGLLLYVLELPPPTLAAKDAVGAVELTITLEPSVRQQGKRISDSSEARWERSAEGIENRADVVGVLIETHRGDNQWKPLVAKAVDKGFLPLAKLEADHGVIAVDSLEPWLVHSFRARLVAKATGLDFDQPIPPKVRNTVVVAAGRLVDTTEEVAWNDFTEKVRAKDPKTLAKLVKPLKDAPPGVTLVDGELAYQGPKGDDASVTVTSDVRFALDRISSDLTDPTKEVATFLVTKQFTDRDGAKLWLKEPQSFKAGIGEVVGGKVKGENPLYPGKQVILELATPFKVVEIKRGQKRIQYWEIRTKSRASGKGKDLSVEPKEMQTDLVVVENVKSKAHLAFTKLSPIKRPPRKDPVLFPHLAADVDEEQEFRKNPSGFVQQELLPSAPKQHPADEGPLAALRDEHPDARDLYSTDTPYFELPDGRLVWWDPLNSALRQFPEPNAMPEAPAAAPAEPKTPTPPAGIPPGAMPPGMIPPGAMPPGMVPPGAQRPAPQRPGTR